jgi:AraC-like DNA-binding protein
MWQRMFAEFVRNDKYFATVTEGIFKGILAAFSRYIHSSPDRRSFVRSVTYIHSHYTEPITVAQLADMENMSEPHYRVCFRKTMGMSPVEYMTDVRIRTSVQLLEETDKKLAEIAQLCGYSDMYYFIRVFKNKTGVTPGRYRGNR